MNETMGNVELTLAERKQVMIEILKKVKEYCDCNHLKYCLYFGTLLGAIRHKGFIPWDDDIDIVMPRRDYELFLKGFNQERSDTLKVLSVENTAGWYMPFAKVVDERTCLREEVPNPIDLAVNIDIFPLDYLSDDYEKALKLNRRVGVYRRWLQYHLMKYVPRRWYKRMALQLMRMVKREQVVKLIDKKAKKYSAVSESRYMASMVTMTTGVREIIEFDCLAELSEAEFEGEMYKVPARYGEVLLHLYGEDYMELPPLEKRVTHHANKAWWR